MKKTAYLNIIVLIIISFHCSSPAKVQQPPPSEKRVVVKSHPISITGIVKSTNLVNIDKSGKNPRYMLHFIVNITKYEDGGWGTVLDPEVTFVGREKDLIEQTGGRIEAGKKVFITAQIIEKSPKTIAVHTIKFL